MNTLEWMKSKATVTNEVVEYDGVKYTKLMMTFIGKLPYHMMMDVNTNISAQKITGSVEGGDYKETYEKMNRYGDKNPRGTYMYTEFVQI